MADPAILPVEGEGASKMADEFAGDIDQDCAEALLESSVMTHEGLMAELSANGEAANNIVRLSGARKFNREDPIEAAAAEVIMRKKI